MIPKSSHEDTSVADGTDAEINRQLTNLLLENAIKPRVTESSAIGYQPRLLDDPAPVRAFLSLVLILILLPFAWLTEKIR